MLAALMANAHTKAADTSARAAPASPPTHVRDDGAPSPGFALSRVPIHPPDPGGARVRGGDEVAEERSGTLGGDATSMSTSNLSAPEWKDFGEFKWWIKWATDGTSGWIVQKIDNTYSGALADGSTITNASVGVEPSYYEAWEVAANGGITGSLGATGNRDRWERPAMPAGSAGSWGMTGTVHWTTRDPQTSGFTSGKVANAGSLLSSKAAAAGMSAPLLTRGAHGMWTSSGAAALPGCFVT